MIHQRRRHGRHKRLPVRRRPLSGWLGLELLEKSLLLSSGLTGIGDASLGTASAVAGTAQLSGMKWFDANQNGVRDPGELGLPGWRIFLDHNDNGVLEQDATVSAIDVPQPILDSTSAFSSLEVSALAGPIQDVDQVHLSY